jgi:hypothetical protein
MRFGALTALRLYVQGRRDGRRGLPSCDGANACTSPFIARMLDEHRQFCATQQLLCARRLVPLRERIARLDREQALLEATEKDTESVLEQRRSAFKPGSEPPRNANERTLDATLLRNRRQAEFEKGLAPLVARAAAAREGLQAQTVERAALMTVIEQQENLARCNCERHARLTERKVTAYWQAALISYRAASARERPPLRPPLLPVLQPPVGATSAWPPEQPGQARHGVTPWPQPMHAIREQEPSWD